jgi:hypothetical protein
VTDNATNAEGIKRRLWQAKVSVKKKTPDFLLLPP